MSVVNFPFFVIHNYQVVVIYNYQAVCHKSYVVHETLQNSLTICFFYIIEQRGSFPRKIKLTEKQTKRPKIGQKGEATDSNFRSHPLYS